MQAWPFNKISSWLVSWLMKDTNGHEFPMCDIERIRYELHPCDVILIEGSSRASEVIKLVTRSNWSHAALYIGRFHDIQDDALRAKILEYYDGDLNEQLIIEGLLGKGTIITPLSHYQKDHIRICRPNMISMEDAQQAIIFAINELGKPYDVLHIFQLLRLLFPIAVIPRHLFLSIFKPSQHREKQICSSMLARAFESIQYPILPKIIRHTDGRLEFIRRNPNLFTPRDFDYSPYFEIIKYPLFSEQSVPYRHLPWANNGTYSNDKAGVYYPQQKSKKQY